MLVAYGAVMLGLMPVATQAVNWTTPVFFSGYLATGSFSRVVVQLVIVALGTLLYLSLIHI